MLFKNMLLNNKKKLKNKIVLESETKSCTYEQLYHYVMYVAERLANIGKQNDKVLLCHYNSIELVVAYFATVVAGKMLLLADPKYKNELSNIIQEYQVEIFIIDHELENQDIHGKSNSQCSLLEACKNYVQTCAISKNDRFLGVTPFFILIA